MKIKDITEHGLVPIYSTMKAYGMKRAKHPDGSRYFKLKEQDITDKDLQQLETYADRLFASLGIDVAFSKHFKDRLNDPRNEKPITMAELTRLFKQIYKQHGKPIAQLGPDAEAVMKDMKTDVNIPFALQWDGNELDLVAKTIMRKPNFATPNPEFRVEVLTKKSDMGDYIDDFRKSDAPQFKGKSKAKRTQMAIAAKLAADDKK